MERPPATFQVDGAAIRTRRMDLGMTTYQCAAAARISRSYLCLIEGGHRFRLRPPTYAGLRTALQIETDDEQLLVPREGQHRKEPDGHQADAPRPHPHEDD